MAMACVLPLFQSRTNWKFRQWHTWWLIILFLLPFIYINLNLASSTMTVAVRSDSRTALCADFDPAIVFEKLDTSINLRDQIHTNEDITEFVCSVMNHDMNLTAKLDCSVTIDPRYQNLQPLASKSHQIRYFFALDLHQAVHVILPLVGSIIEAMRYLGPEFCALSIVEGRSTDDTYAILAGLKAELAAMRVSYFLSRSYVDPKAGGENRITALSHLRNRALQPLLEKYRSRYIRPSSNPIIIFVNDVVLCPEDILELIHQHVMQSATMTCAFDWNPAGRSFYDSWVSRSLSGNLFFEITHDGKHWLTEDMFFDHPDSAARWDQSLPIQVYSCWGGMVTLDAAPFVRGDLAFRSSDKDECYMGEPMTLAKDLWRLNLGKILAVPAVNVAYEYDTARDAKEVRGYVHKTVGHTRYNTDAELVKWQSTPPPMVKCMPVFNRQWWVAPV